jgi:hypothetical protein
MILEKQNTQHEDTNCLGFLTNNKATLTVQRLQEFLESFISGNGPPRANGMSLKTAARYFEMPRYCRKPEGKY